MSYGALGMSHHSAQDIAAMAAIPNMRVYLPSDRFQTAKLIEALLTDENRLISVSGRNAVEDIYSEENTPFEDGQSDCSGRRMRCSSGSLRRDGPPALDAVALLKKKASAQVFWICTA